MYLQKHFVLSRFFFVKIIRKESPAEIRRFLEVRSLKSHCVNDGVPRGFGMLIAIARCGLHAKSR